MILQLTIFTVTNISQEQFRSLVILNRAFIYYDKDHCLLIFSCLPL